MRVRLGFVERERIEVYARVVRRANELTALDFAEFAKGDDERLKQLLFALHRAAALSHPARSTAPGRH